jgi:hypothetical protein
MSGFVFRAPRSTSITYTKGLIKKHKSTPTFVSIMRIVSTFIATAYKSGSQCCLFMNKNGEVSVPTYRDIGTQDYEIITI